MACRFTYNGKDYDQDGLAEVLRKMPPAEAAKFIPGIEASPDMPFKESWPDLALKRMLHKAATETNPDGSFKYHAMSWTPGEAQAARYDLSKQLETLSVYRHSGNKYSIVGDLKNGTQEHNFGSDIPEEKLADHIGKELAEKIIKNKENQQDFTNPELKIGGEGMKTFYDKMLVDKANALGKRYGARVEQSDIPVTKLNEPHVGDGDFPFEIRRPDGSVYNRTRTREIAQGEIDDHPGFTLHVDEDLLKKRTNGQKIHILPITPELRAATAKGFPLFALGAVAAPALAQRQLPPMDDRAAKALATKPPDVGLGR